MDSNRIERIRRCMHHQADGLGNLLVEAFHYLALFVIGAVIAWAATGSPRCQDSCRLIGFTQTEHRGRKEPCNAALLC